MPVNVALDATMLDTLMLCPAKFNYRFNLNKTTPKKAVPLDRGTLVHLGLEAYYNELVSSKCDFNTSRDKLIHVVRLAGVESDLEPAVAARCLEVLLDNVDYWRLVDSEMTIKAVEAPFIYTLHEDEDIKINMIGKIDLLIDNKSYNNLPIDHKSYDRDYPMRRKVNQFCNYVYATGSNYLVVNKIGFQTSLKAEQKYKRPPLSYDPIFLEQWKQNVIKWVRYYLDCVVENSWPLNDTSCDKFNRLCEYYEICDSSGIEAKEYKLMTNFIDAEKWDVSRVLGSGKE